MLNTEAKILLVDDMETFLELHRALLEDLGYRNVSTAKDASQAKAAMEKAEAAGAPFRLVMSDINMPGENGLELLQWIRSRAPSATLPVFMASSQDDLDFVMTAAESSANAYLVKPFTKERLLTKLEALPA